VPRGSLLWLVLAIAILNPVKAAPELLAEASRLEEYSSKRRQAESEDKYGGAAARYYRELAEMHDLEFDDLDSLKSILERGLIVSLRDSDLENRDWFHNRLTEISSPLLRLCTPGKRPEVNLARIPGGMRSLIFMARGTGEATSESFFSQFTRLIARNPSYGLSEHENLLLQQLDEYLTLAHILLGQGDGDSGSKRIVLSTRDDQALAQSERILGLLGWRISKRQPVEVEPATQSNRVWRHQIATALSIDELALKERLERGGDFEFEISEEWAEVLLGEEVWRSEFFAGKESPGGFPQFLVREPRMAALYVALSNMERETAEQLSRLFPLGDLIRHVAVLFDFSPSLLVREGRVLVPGGEEAERVWESLVKASPRKPREFLDKLFQRDDGKLFRFYHALSSLDLKRQRFFTRSPQRTERLYQAARQLPEFEGKVAETIRAGTLRDLLSEVMLDASGRLQFPGSPEVWLVAQGHSSSFKATQKLLLKVSRTTAPEIEDDILVHLIKTRYRTGPVPRKQVDNFLAVNRLETLRSSPLGAESALLLAQNFATHEGVFPYFADLRALNLEAFQEFFQLTSELRSLDTVEANLVLGQFHALTKLLCIVERNGTFSPEETADLFLDLCRRFRATARDPARNTLSVLEFLRHLLKRHHPDWEVDQADEVVERLILPPIPDSQVVLGDSIIPISPDAERRRAYRKVLELQQVPALRTLLAMESALERLIQGNEGAPATILLELSSQLPSVQLPPEQDSYGMVKQSLFSYSLDPLQKLNRQLAGETARRRPRPGRVENLADRYFAAMGPQLTLALAGVIYARYLNPDDLLVSQDPLFLRKHSFVNLRSKLDRRLFPYTNLVLTSESEGSYVVGGFSSFAVVAGTAAISRILNLDPQAVDVAVSQLGSLRMTDWDQLRQETLLLFHVKTQAAKEWALLAALDAEVFEALREASAACMSAARRNRFLDLIQSKRFEQLWDELTLSELYFMADRLAAALPPEKWTSAVHQEVRNLESHADSLHWLGPSLGNLRRYSSPRLMELPSYEDSSLSRNSRLIAERVSELSLYLARLATVHGIPVECFSILAEPLARRTLAKTGMFGVKDWVSVLNSFKNLSVDDIREILEGQ
jgi:hypothetical protein